MDDDKRWELISTSSDGVDSAIDLVAKGVDLATSSPLGSAIQGIAGAFTERGKLIRYDQKMAGTYLGAIFESLSTVEGIATNITRLREQLDQAEWPRPEEVAATFRALEEVAKKTTNAKKREILRHAAINAFDPSFYEEGLVRRFITAIEDLEYGDVELLRRMVQVGEERPLDGTNETFVAVPRETFKFGSTVSMDAYHVSRLESVGAAKVGSGGSGQVTTFGLRLLQFVSEPQGDDE